MRLVLPELGIDGPADVLAIEPCPEIELGRGRVVTGTFTTASCQVMELRFVESEEVLEPTPSHRIFSEKQQGYVPAEDLAVGERVRTRSRRVLTIASTRLQPTPQRVYNCEVEQEHHFYVGEAGVLAHNQCLTAEEEAIGAWEGEGGAVTPVGRIRNGEVTSFQDFVDRSVVGDNLEGHELWQHANLKCRGLQPNGFLPRRLRIIRSLHLIDRFIYK